MRRPSLEDLFHELCSMSAEAREARCSVSRLSPEERRWLVEMLAHHDAAAAEQFLDGRDPTETSHEPAIPERIAGYRIRGLLGRGGMGTVYFAEEAGRAGKGVVALKIAPAAAVDAEVRRRFLAETALLRQLDHPGVCRVLDAGIAESETGSLPWMAMELVEGTTLTEHASRSGLDRNTRCLLLARVADAVDYIHRHGIVHQDLKPRNIVVDPRVDAVGLPKLMDFGAASRLCDRSSRMGTLDYMSPEQLRIGSLPEVRSDVYALGVIGHELLFGRVPSDLSGLEPEEALEILRARRRDPAVSSTGSDGYLEAVVARAISFEAGARQRTAGELAAELRGHDRGAASGP